ncbi:glycosyltransferase [Sulfuritalea sp.]|uniref:glycosyltransferase n=1 Tax=Sulfuritalea sp. TaxID=2480090 RepID=UPI001AC9D3B4|nr:glycosyltransferase [Sulfuritalea sp.]MBN8474952.1 glycosyltransferase [Sulfuritalea sp.]
MIFSLAVPVFHHANFLPFALESIRAQRADIRVAVMDATPDESVQKVLEHYADLLSYRRHGPDSGQTAAIQEGWDHTDGDIVAWLCADDYYFPNALDSVEEVFIRHPEVDVVYGDAVFVDDSDQFIGYFPIGQFGTSSIEREDFICQPSCFVRRTALARIGRLNPDLHYIMDWDLWTRLYRAGAKFHYLDKPLSVVRMYRGTKTASRSWARFKEIGRHVARNSSPIAALRSLSGFYYQDLKTLDVTGIERVLLRMMEFYSRQKKRFKGPGPGGDKNAYGLSRHGNEVAGEADVLLPWYKPSPPVGLWVRSDLDVEPDVHLNGTRLSCKSGTGFCYDIPAFSLSTPLLSLKLSCAARKSWALYGVEFF